MPVARYREFAPSPPLRDYVRRFFTFVPPPPDDEPCRAITSEILYSAPGSYTTPMFADSQTSLVFSFGKGYRIDGLWDAADGKHCGHVIGAISSARPAAHGERIVQVGAYFRPGQAWRFFAIPAYELTDRILPLSDLWGTEGMYAEDTVGEAESDGDRVRRIEALLLQRLHLSAGRHTAVDIRPLATFVQQIRGMIHVAELADTAGVSRQYLGRLFEEQVGIKPKLFCRLARFRAALTSAGHGEKGNAREGGAMMAAELGYVDQSHMIAEFREFSGLTPKPLLLKQRVHPFMDLADRNALF